MAPHSSQAPGDKEKRSSSPVCFPMGLCPSHGGHVGPGREGVQMKHGPPPAVDGQRDADDSNDVHHYARPGLRDMRQRNL